MNVALVLCGGVGNRFGGGAPKQYLPVDGHMCVEYVIRACCEAKSVDRVVVCAAPPYEYLLPLREAYDFELTPSGEERNGTIRLGLEYIRGHFHCEKLAVIDSARPLTTAALIDALMEKLDDYDAAIQCRHLSDALGRYGEQDVDRSQYYSIQTPECFRFDVFFRHFREDFTLDRVFVLRLYQQPEDDLPRGHRLSYLCAPKAARGPLSARADAEAVAPVRPILFRAPPSPPTARRARSAEAYR